MNRTSFPLVGVALDAPVRTKKNRAGTLKAAKDKIRRVVERHTEVLVKVSGSCKGVRHMLAHMEYISRNGKLDLENEWGEQIRDRDRLLKEHKEWANDLGVPRKNGRDTINVVLSMPAGTASEAVRRAVREFAKEQFAENHQYLIALHCPENDKRTQNPHVHLTVKALGFDGRKLDPRKADLQEWRECFAEKMREQGYEAEATPRRSRGVIEKGKRQAIWAMEKYRAKSGCRVQADKIKEAANALKGLPVTSNPYRQKIVQAQNAIRKGWLDGAAQLEQSSDLADKNLARKIRQFVDGMPKKLMDERERLKAALLHQLGIRKKPLQVEVQNRDIRSLENKDHEQER